MDELILKLKQKAPHWKLFVRVVGQMRAEGWRDTYIARQMVDDYFRLTQKLLPQHLVEEIIKSSV